MKKVRFKSPNKCILIRMEDSECHSPRPFMEQRAPAPIPDVYNYQRVVYSNDPVHRFEYSDSSPYPLAKKTFIPSVSDSGPSSDLNLSMLDNCEPRPLCRPFSPIQKYIEPKQNTILPPKVLSSIENTVPPPNVLCKDDNFFLRKDNIGKYGLDMNPLQSQFNRLSLDKENAPLAKKAEFMKTVVSSTPNLPVKVFSQPQAVQDIVADNVCPCHHCKRGHIPQQPTCNYPNIMSNSPAFTTCPCQPQIPVCSHCDQHKQMAMPRCIPHSTATPASSQNAVDQKTWAIEKYENSSKPECKDIEKQTNISKEKREPTISDLLKIIKLQNEQLQLLQEKVDKFITVSNGQQKIQQVPVQNYMTEHVALQTIDSEHKISIGVMTSFEMVRTSTVINKEVLKQTNENAQIQCNRSQISIKEVVSKQPVNLNFLDGIMPVVKAPSDKETSTDSAIGNETMSRNTTDQTSRNVNDEKTLNEMSLYNVQVDNATTPLMSPDQSLYLDVRDYSDSESNSDDQSNVGWTYYNKVMTHVNGMLEDSQMPSSASALYRNTRRQCVQMQIDKTNVSVTKRVKFGDDPIGIRQPHIYAGSTDTSLKMNQLAAKYLNLKSVPSMPHHVKTTPIEMSFATRKYMEQHKLLQGHPSASRSPLEGEMPRFLDITALKQQPKLL